MLFYDDLWRNERDFYEAKEYHADDSENASMAYE